MQHSHDTVRHHHFIEQALARGYCIPFIELPENTDKIGKLKLDDSFFSNQAPPCTKPAI